jgi:hypothetical protein
MLGEVLRSNRKCYKPPIPNTSLPMSSRIFSPWLDLQNFDPDIEQKPNSAQNSNPNNYLPTPWKDKNLLWRGFRARDRSRGCSCLWKERERRIGFTGKLEALGVVRAVYRRYPRCVPMGRLLNFAAHDHWQGWFAGHPKYILLVLSYTSNYFTCICRSSVITSTHIALPLLVPHVIVLCCWSALTGVHICHMNTYVQALSHFNQSRKYNT